MELLLLFTILILADHMYIIQTMYIRKLRQQEAGLSILERHSVFQYLCPSFF